MNCRGFRALLAAFAALAGACRAHDPTPRGPSPAPAATQADVAAGVTFNKDVAPILLQHCATCHRPIAPNAAKAVFASGDPVCFGGAPFALVDYRDARDHARQIADVTARRVMPPWLPDRGVGVFANARTLGDDQIATIERWVAAGMPEGNPADKPPAPRWPDGWQLGTPDLVVQMPEPYTLAATGSDVFRNFVVPVPISSTRYVRAIEFHAGNPQTLHHATLAIDRFGVSRKLDRADQGPGFAAMPDDRVENVYGWTPGKAPFLEPPDRAWSLEPGSDLVIQLHMLPSGAPQTIRPSIGLFFSDRPPSRTPLEIKLESKSIDIPAGRSDYAIEDRYVLPADIEVLSIYPHAHYLARDMKGVATLPDGTVTPLIHIRSWDFRWQDQVPLCRAAVPAAGHHRVDALHLRQLGRQSAQPASSRAARQVGAAVL